MPDKTGGEDLVIARTTLHQSAINYMVTGRAFKLSFDFFLTFFSADSFRFFSLDLAARKFRSFISFCLVSLDFAVRKLLSFTSPSLFLDPSFLRKSKLEVIVLFFVELSRLLVREMVFLLGLAKLCLDLP